ncbi:MAG: LssY C-terminal domain-containing protein [Acidobacteriaceae bacterium]|nr:LssY C-terminal domain-containing protein [Acidobacteriaceae bacterium]
MSSYATKAGTRISGIEIAPVSDAGTVLLPAGTVIQGSVAQVRKVGTGVVHETAAITLHFDRLVLEDGRTVPVQCRVTEVENARESVDSEGRIRGIRSTSTISHRTSGLAGSISLGDPIAAIFTTAASSGLLRFSEPEISLPQGTELMAVVTAPLNLPPVTPERIPPVAATEAQKNELAGLVKSLPFRTYTEKSNIPSDFTNLIFIGKHEELQRAFERAGWVPVDKLTAETTYQTFRSIAENQGYKAAPMSMLTLGGRRSEMNYAKTLNTFSKRHHLRIWETDERWDGETVWTSSSTHDIGIGFSKSSKTFIHLIDSHTDNERAKVVNDLLLTGCVSAVQLVGRPWIPKGATNGTGEELITDGRIAVLELNDCNAPEEEAEGTEASALPVHGNQFERTNRQIVLTLKNNLVRDNVVVMGYSGAHYLLSPKKKENAAPSRQMEVGGTAYTVDDRFNADLSYTPPSTWSATPAALAAPKRAEWKPASVELGIRGGWLAYAGGNGGAIGYFIQSPAVPNDFVLLVLANEFDSGWGLGGTVTFNPQKHFSHEFSFDHYFTTFDLKLGVIASDSTSPDIQTAFGFAATDLGTSQFAYNLLYNFTPKTARLRPYLAMGPSLQLMHLTDAPVKRAPGWFRLGLSNVGLITAAYDFGSTPPLQGGGIFQAGLNYGAGIRYRIAPRWMFRIDYRETLTSQPDFWSKSKKDILNNIDVGDSTIQVIGPVFAGSMRQVHATGGISFTF